MCFTERQHFLHTVMNSCRITVTNKNDKYRQNLLSITNTFFLSSRKKKILNIIWINFKRHTAYGYKQLFKPIYYTTFQRNDFLPPSCKLQLHLQVEQTQQYCSVYHEKSIFYYSNQHVEPHVLSFKCRLNENSSEE